MVEHRLRLTGIGEGMRVRVQTELKGADSPRNVQQALLNLFPDISADEHPNEPEFGNAIDVVWSHDGVSLGPFLQQLHEQRILDTALDAMSQSLRENCTRFAVSRLAAYAGKIAFPIPGENPLGGVLTIEIEGDGLEDWLQAATWHEGRSQVPRAINDDLAMADDGEASTWV